MGEIIKCPSGLTGEIRPLTVREADMLAGANRKTRPAAMAKVLSDCWVDTQDPGPYTTPLDWDKVLQGDRTFVLLAVRSATHGPEYIFKPQCPSDGCKARFEWALDLKKDLQVRELAAEDKLIFAAGNQFEAVIESSGTKVTYRLPIGADERKAALQKQQRGRAELLTLALRMRIDDIEGHERTELRKYISSMGLHDANSLLEQFDEHDCGVETLIEVECSSCLTEFDVELPFDRGFFFPSRKRQSMNRAEL